jgi:carbon starvation protein
MGLALLVITILVLLLSYRYYAAPKVNQNIEPSWSRSTPARRYMDNVNYLPTPAGVLAGFQFKSISLDVIIGPVIAIQFGWLPAVLWLLIGAIFFGWVQDYLAAIMSMRKSGSPLGNLIGAYFNPTARFVSLSFIFIYLLIILGQFGLLLSTLMGRENVSIGIFFLVFAGFLAGLMIYRWRINLKIATLLSVLVALLGIWITSISPIQNFVVSFNRIIADQGSLNLPSFYNPVEISWLSLIWLLIFFGICYLGAILPIWRFAVPFNYVSSWVVLLGFGLAVIGLLVGTLSGSISTVFEIPPLVTTVHPNLGPLWPILFVTLSSGAVSGWHSLVSSFSTSRQVEKEPYTMPVTTGAMFGNTLMVTIVIIFAATFGVSSGILNAEQNYSLTAGPASVLAIGLAKTWHVIDFPETLGSSISALFLTIMGLTVLQLVLRFSGMVTADLFSKRISALRKPLLNLPLVILLALIIIISGFWESLWVLFAGANLLLAAVVLLLASIWLVKQGKSFWWTFIPAASLFVTALSALFYVAIYQAFYQQIIIDLEVEPSFILGNLVTIVFGLLFMVFGAYLFFIGLQQLNRARSNYS